MHVLSSYKTNQKKQKVTYFDTLLSPPTLSGRFPLVLVASLPFFAVAVIAFFELVFSELVLAFEFPVSTHFISNEQLKPRFWISFLVWTIKLGYDLILIKISICWKFGLRMIDRI